MLDNFLKKGFLLSFLFCILLSFSQNEKINLTEKVYRINFINPGVEIELPTNTKSTFSIGLGVGYGGSYPKISTNNGNGFKYLISPFVDVQHKWFYNLKTRKDKKRNIKYNSGNFYSFRLLTRAKDFKSNFERSTNLDFAFGPTYGIQRSLKKFHLVFDFGPIYYFDTNFKGDIFPLIIQLNIGYNL